MELARDKEPGTSFQYPYAPGWPGTGGTRYHCDDVTGALNFQKIAQFFCAVGICKRAGGITVKMRPLMKLQISPSFVQIETWSRNDAFNVVMPGLPVSTTELARFVAFEAPIQCKRRSCLYKRYMKLFVQVTTDKRTSTFSKVCGTGNSGRLALQLYSVPLEVTFTSCNVFRYTQSLL